MRVSTSLSFDGQCEAAFKFYEQCLGGKLKALMPYEGSPMEKEVPAEWGQKIMHAELAVTDAYTIMGGDCMPGQYAPAQGTSIVLDVEDPAEADRVFNALAENGTIEMPIEETFWAKRFGTLKDQFGIPWMVNCNKPEEAQE